MATNLKRLVESVGLSSSEADIYFAALRLGSDTVQRIAQEANVSRSAAYDAIQLLQLKGLISTSFVGKKRLYAAEDPERFVQMVKDQQDDLEQRANDLMRSMDVFKMLAGGSKPVVRTFEGQEAIHAFFDFIERTKPEEFLEICNVDDLYQAVDAELLLSARSGYAWTPKRSRTLYCGRLKNPRPGFEYRVLAPGFDTFRGSLSVFGPYVALISFSSSPLSVVIESDVFASSMRFLFESAWREAGYK